MRIFAIPVETHERKPRIDLFADEGEIELVLLGDTPPVVHARAAERIHAHAHLGAADHIHVEHGREVADVGGEVIVLVRGRRTAAPARPARASLPAVPSASMRLASVSIQPVTSVSAGPPFGGLYLKPPLSGGLWDGVMTMPSASPEVRPRL